MIIHIGVYAVDKVVGGHNSPRVRLSNGNLEWAKVDLAKGPFGYNRVDGQSVRLLLIGDEICMVLASPRRSVQLGL